MLLLLLLFFSTHPACECALFTYEKIYSIFMWNSDREFLQINNIKIKFIFGNLKYTIVNLYEACSRFVVGCAELAEERTSDWKYEKMN